MKYRLSQIAAVVGGRFSGTDCEVQSVVTDSRSLTCELGSGPVFVATIRMRSWRRCMRAACGLL